MPASSPPTAPSPIAQQRRQKMRWLVCAGLLGSLSLAGCQKAGDSAATPSPATQVAARVNAQDISVHQVEALLQAQPALGVRYGNKAGEAALSHLVEQELAAQAARAADLDHSPRVLQALELAKREVLARAYQDQLASQAVEPSSDEVDRFYDAHPELFAQRRRYALKSTLLEVSAPDAATLQPKIEALARAEDLEPLLRGAGVSASPRMQQRFAEEIPAAVLAKLFTLQPGQSAVFGREGGVEVLTLLGTEPSPMSMAAARTTITAFLTQERRRTRIDQGMKTLRDAAQIEYPMRAASGAAAASSVAASAAH